MHSVRTFRTGIPGVEAFGLASSRHFPRHSHDQFGIGLIESGGHRSWSGSGWVDGSAGDIIMVNPGEMHDGESLGSRDRCWRMIYIDPNEAYGLFDGDIAVSTAVLLPRVNDKRQSRNFTSLFSTFVEDYVEPEHREENFLKTVMYAFEHHSTYSSPKRGTPPPIGKIKQQIDSAPELPYSLKEMAAQVSTSRFRLLRAFERATGATPHAYILQRRVMVARKLIASGFDLAQVSLETGFADQSHMTRAFVRQIGITPARYRAAAYSGRSSAISFKMR